MINAYLQAEIPVVYQHKMNKDLGLHLCLQKPP